MNSQFMHEHKCQLLGAQHAQDKAFNYLKRNLYIDHVTLKNSLLVVEYDFRYIAFSQILEMIKANNCDYANGWFTRLKYQFMTNADLKGRENLAIEPFCCDKVKIRKDNL